MAPTTAPHHCRHPAPRGQPILIAATQTHQVGLRPGGIPVLAFNGAYDPIEQPRNWAGAQQVFPNSRDITLPGQGHDTTNTWGVCAGPLTQTFIEQASLAQAARTR